MPRAKAILAKDRLCAIVAPNGGAAMSDELNAGKNAQRMLPLPRNCSQCGESASSISILRTRDGKSFRLYKCASCGGLAWVLEEQ